FFLHVTDTPLEDQRGYVSVRATLVGEGDQVRVYRDLQVTPGEIANGLVRELIELLDRQILPRSRVILGQHRDVDGDGKLAVLLTGWLERLQGGRTSVQGFVRSQDFDPSGVPPYSNRADVLYLNAGLRPGPELVPLLAHEYAHAVVCSLRLPGGLSATGLPVEADWLNEGYAHLAERMQQAGWSNLEHRITAFLDAPESAPLVVQDYYRTGRWRDAGCRGATFLFLDWCLQQSDESLLRALASDPLTGVAKLEEHSGIPFAELFRGWTIALHQGGWPALDLNSDLGRHTLAGPKIRTWNVAETECALELQGTSATFVRCQFESHRPRCQIRIEAPRNARLQVTAALRR
ncbi:MAG: hypothetical protein ACKV0T_02160, partial [Planctomycetales bacterium]